MRYSDEAFMMDKNEARHDKVLEDLVARLARKKGFLFIKEDYHGPRGGHHGEMDVHLVRRTSDGRVVHRYYEVKARYSDGGERRAIQQFERHAKYHEGGDWKYVLYTPQVVKRIRL